MNTNNRFLTYSGISGTIAVTLGAMGAHYLKSKVNESFTLDNLQSFQTGVTYQMYHTLALLGVSLLPENKKFKYAGNLFLLGIILFSGSIYLLSLRGLFEIEGLKFLGPVTPLGGLCFIAGWIFIIIGSINKSDKKL